MFKNKKGFTLLELLVAVLIIGILAGVALPQYQMAAMKSRYSTLMDMVRVISDAEERYYLSHDKYTATFEGLDIDLSGCTLSEDKKTCNYDWGICNINNSKRQVYCENNVQLKNAYIVNLRQRSDNAGQKMCFALTFDMKDKWNKLCKHIGAKYWTGAKCLTDGENHCRSYRFLNRL